MEVKLQELSFEEGLIIILTQVEQVIGHMTEEMELTGEEMKTVLDRTEMFLKSIVKGRDEIGFQKLLVVNLAISKALLGALEINAKKMEEGNFH